MRTNWLILLMLLSGCGVSQKQLKDMDSLLEKSKQADCSTIRFYLNAVQQEIQKKIDK